MGSFAERLHRAMAMADIKPVDLCTITGIGKSSISQYLSGEYKPKQKNIYLIATALNVSPAYLMGFTDDPTNYDDTDLIANISAEILQHFGGDVKKAVEFQKAVAKDALATPLYKEHHTIALSRSDNPDDDLPEEAQKQIEDFRAYIRQKYKKPE